jgi:hypothetical protein
MRPESLAATLQQLYTDSVARAFEQLGRIPIRRDVDSLVAEQLRRHPPTMVIFGRRRLVVSDFEGGNGSEDLDENVSTLLSEGFRERLAPFYEVLDPDDAPPQARRPRDERTLGRALGAGAVVRGVYTLRDDRLVVQVAITDVAVGRVIRTVQSDPVSPAETVRALDTLVPRARAALDAIRWSRAAVVHSPVPAPTPIPPPSPGPPTPE